MTTTNQPQGLKQSSQMDNLINRLDEEVSRYYNALNQIKSTRSTIQEVNCMPENAKESKPSQFNPGIFYRLDSLIERFALLNNDAEVEAKVLSEYL